MSKTLTLFLVLIVLSIAASSTAALGGNLGSRTPIPDVKNNKEIQELGQYCVQEYNNGLAKEHQKKGSRIDPAPIVFAKVVEAEKQVVSGIKYYLKIATTTVSSSSSSGRVTKKFDAVVVVKPWVHSKQLLNFSPSPSHVAK